MTSRWRYRWGPLLIKPSGQYRLLLGGFPAGFIGADETRRILAAGEDGETIALIRNPSVSAKLLEALYCHAGPFATNHLPPAERRSLRAPLNS